ncbi:KH domain-containing, RNA-binding, signal transduction-associated protein 2, partial [Frankliniella fusca]
QGVPAPCTTPWCLTYKNAVLISANSYPSYWLTVFNHHRALVLLQFNFVGKLLGPQGNSLKRLQEETMTKMAILGRGSMRDRQKEEELRLSGDPKFCHLQLELHVEVTALAPPAEAHARIALALAEVRRFLVPDFNDDIRQEQMWELHVLKSSRDHLKHLASGPAGAGGGAGPSPQEDAVAVAAAAAAGLGPLPDPACLEPSVAPGPLAAGPLAPGPSRGLHSPIGPDVAARLFCARTAAAGGGRKRPYIAMSPTKRTVLSILARARAAQAKDMIGAH